MGRGKDRVKEVVRIRMKALSPLHIGGVYQKVTPFEYIEKGGKIYHLSEERFIGFLKEKGLVEDFVSAVEREGHRFRVAEFIESKGISLTPSLLEKVSMGKMQLLGRGLREFRAHIRDGLGRVYIPATSIKGSIRTVLLYRVLQRLRETDNEKFKREVVDYIRNTDPRKVNRREPFKELQKKWLEGFKLKERTRSPNTDWLRQIHVTDAYPVDRCVTQVIPVNIVEKGTDGKWSYRRERNGSKTTIWVETVPEGTEFEFTLGWDRALQEEFKRDTDNTRLLSYFPEDTKELISSIRVTSEEVVEYERTFTRGHSLCQWYESNLPEFRIGFGCGMLSTTIILLLPDNLRKWIRNKFTKNKGNAEAPMSRRVWLKGNQPIPLGWCTIELRKGES